MQEIEGILGLEEIMAWTFMNILGAFKNTRFDVIAASKKDVDEVNLIKNHSE